MRYLCFVFLTALVMSHSNAKADLVSVSLDFEYGFDSGIFNTVSGNVKFTVENTESTSGLAVDSITFTDPLGHFKTEDVFMDFRQGDDTNIANNPYEFDIFFSELSVFSNKPGDFLISAGLVSLDPGDDYEDPFISTNFFYFDGSGFVLSQTDTNHITVSQAVPEPALAGILGFGVLGVCLTRRRRKAN